MLLISFGVLLLISVSYEDNLPQVVHPDAFRTTIEMIKRQGYPAEEHIIGTPDGYLLTLHRIPHGMYNTFPENRAAVFLMHGLLMSSADWVNMGPEKSLAYQLVDAGYDVWMGNARGNKYSRRHVSLNPDKDAAFWNFSWHEIGTTDLPTMIDYVLRSTHQEKLYYAGHSQGTTSFFVMGSERPEYNTKIQLMAALAPVAYMSHLENAFLQLIAQFTDTLGFAAHLIGVHEFLPSSLLFQLAGELICNDKSIIQEVCSNILFLIAGWDSDQLNRTMIPVIASNVPAGASTMQIEHYGQGIKSGYFRQFDYGAYENHFKHKSIVPPDYKTRNITAPIALIYSQNDMLAAVVDVERLAGELPNLVQAYLISYKRFNHLDFLYAINVKELIYNRVISLFKEHPIV